jgi:hypothetical protein
MQCKADYHLLHHLMFAESYRDPLSWYIVSSPFFQQPTTLLQQPTTLLQHPPLFLQQPAFTYTFLTSVLEKATFDDRYGHTKSGTTNYSNHPYFLIPLMDRRCRALLRKDLRNEELLFG